MGERSGFESRPAKRRPSLGRSKSERGLDQFDTPPIALAPLFAHEPLLAGLTIVCEPFCGLGNLVIAMRERGLTVHASDIMDRGCPDSVVLDFLKMTDRPLDCDVCCPDPPFSIAMEIIEHAWRLGFRLVILLMEPSFLFSADRFERIHPHGHLRRLYPLAERLKDIRPAATPHRQRRQEEQPAPNALLVRVWPKSASVVTPQPSQFQSTIRRRACRGRPPRAVSSAPSHTGRSD